MNSEKKKRKEYQNELAALESLEESDNLTAEQIDRKVWLVCENLKSLEQEETYWYERSLETWLLKGENNTAFFSQMCKWKEKKKLY